LKFIIKRHEPSQLF